jgi:hypothetical protein
VARPSGPSTRDGFSGAIKASACRLRWLSGQPLTVELAEHTGDTCQLIHQGKSMVALTDQFSSALSNIEPSDDDKVNAPIAHQDVRSVLEADATLEDWGIDPGLIGSYKRQVSIRRVYDVDVFCRLGSLPAASPAMTFSIASSTS